MKRSPATLLAKSLPPKQLSLRRDRVHETLLKQVRCELGLTMKNVADNVGVSSSTVFEAEAGCDVTLVVARKFAEFYGKSVDELWPVKQKGKP